MLAMVRVIALLLHHGAYPPGYDPGPEWCRACEDEMHYCLQECQWGAACDRLCWPKHSMTCGICAGYAPDHL